MPVAIRIQAPPKGIEVTGKGTSPTDAEMEEEQKARDEFLDILAPYLT